MRDCVVSTLGGTKMFLSIPHLEVEPDYIRIPCSWLVDSQCLMKDRKGLKVTFLLAHARSELLSVMFCKMDLAS